MAKYGFVAGETVDKVAEKLQEKSPTTQIVGRWETISELKTELDRGSSEIINSLDAILILDFGFEKGSDIDANAYEFVSLQDSFNSKGLDNTKLYLFTKRGDLLDRLKSPVQGIEGILYPRAEVLKTSAYNSNLMIGVFEGKYSGTGLHHADLNKRTQVDRVSQERDSLIKDARRVEDDYLNYGKNQPISKLNKKENIDSPEFIKKMEEDRRNQEVEARKQTTESKRVQAIRDRNLKLLEKGKDPITDKKTGRTFVEELELDSQPNVNFEPLEGSGNIGLDAFLSSPEATTGQRAKKSPIDNFENYAEDTKPAKPIPKPKAPSKSLSQIRDESKVTINTGTISDVPTVADLSTVFNRLDANDNDSVDQKLRQDTGIISVISDDNAGGSGFVAQAAEMYAMAGRSVLILDLDLIKRTQTLYFSNFNKAAMAGKGSDNALKRVAQGTSVVKNAVRVSTRVSVVGISRNHDKLPLDYNATISVALNEILAEAAENYDIILLDIPLRHLSYYFRYLEDIHHNIFILENKLYSLETFFTSVLDDIAGQDDIVGKQLLSKSNIVLNKVVRGRRDTEGFEIDKNYIRKYMVSAGNPYDLIQVVGEIPFYENWENQYINNVRYIWDDESAIMLYRNIFNKVV